MRSLKLRILFGLLVLAGTAGTATPPCALIGEIARHLSAKNIMGPLTPEMISALRGHRIWAKYGKNDGSDLEFTFLFHGNAALSPGEVKQGEMGESVQSHFVAATLKALFPQAHLYADAGPPGPGKRKIRIFVQDSKEGGVNIEQGKRQRATSAFLDMPLLKTANGRNLPLGKDFIRSELGIQPDRFVISDYNFRLSYKLKDLPKFLRDSGKDPAKCIIFASSRLSAETLSPLAVEMYRDEHPGVKVHALSTLRLGELDGPGPYLILNDTRGILPAINRAANVVLINGPLNLFEGLNEGTPTIFIPYAGGAPHYDAATYQKMAQLALNTRGAITIPDENHLAPLLAQLGDNLPKVQIPAYLVANGDRSAFLAYLDTLEKPLDSEIGTEPKPQRKRSWLPRWWWLPFMRTSPRR